MNHGTWTNSGDGATDIDDGEWHHVAGSYDGSVLRVYVDGVEENSNDIGAVTSSSTPEHVYIGAEGMGREFWRGVIDDVGLFAIALSDAEINDIMSGGLAATTPVSPSGKLSTTWGSIKYRHL